MSCAARLLDQGHKAAALAIYNTLIGEQHPKQVRLAGQRGIFACAGKTE
jgi:hypothetical protein